MSAPSSAPRKHKLALLVWMGIYPLVTLISVVLGPVLAQLPILLRTLVMTLILVPVMVYGIIPFIQTRFGAWLRK
jgi:antibiotic biosynthesis monooxygenase (ABM) superfamily enzyme